MIKDEYVSYKTAKLLKEKGFDAETEHEMWYVCKKYSTGVPWNAIDYKVGDITREYADGHVIPMPTQQMAMRWLREVHKIEVRVDYDRDKSSWWGATYPMDLNPDDDIEQKALAFDYKGKTYEEAAEAGIIYTLENLI